MLTKYGYADTEQGAIDNTINSLPEGANIKGIYAMQRNNEWVCTIIYKYNDCNYGFK